MNLHLAKFDHSLTCQNLILAFLHNNVQYEYLSILLFSTSVSAINILTNQSKQISKSGIQKNLIETTQKMI